MDEDAERESKPSMDELTFPTRLLELVLQKSFVGCLGRLSSLTFLDMLVMYCLLSGLKMNMPRMMIDYMVAAQKDKKSGFLPYGMWLTKLFQKFDVDLSNEAVEHVRSNPVSIKTINQSLGYEYDEERQDWLNLEIKRAPRRHAPSQKRVEDDGAEADDDDDIDKPKPKTIDLERVLLGNQVLQEMLCRLHPTVFTPDVMSDIHDIAMSKVATRADMHEEDSYLGEFAGVGGIGSSNTDNVGEEESEQHPKNDNDYGMKSFGDD